MVGSFRGLILSIGLVACGGGVDTPAERCDVLVDIVCDRLVECFPAAGTHAACVSSVQQSLPCGRAVRVEPRYPRCVDQLETFSCAALFPPPDQELVLPADCNGVIITE